MEFIFIKLVVLTMFAFGLMQVLHEMQLLFKVHVLEILEETLPQLAHGILKQCRGTELHQKLTDEMDAELEDLRRKGNIYIYIYR